MEKNPTTWSCPTSGPAATTGSSACSQRAALGAARSVTARSSTPVPLLPQMGDSPRSRVVSGIDFPDDGRGLAVVDWDHDGDLDLWLSNRSAPRIRFLRNNSTGANQSLMLHLIGNGTTTNRDAIGARVEVTTTGENTDDDSHLKRIKTLRAGEGFLSQSSKWVGIGLGTAAGIEKVTVRWPGGSTETFTGVEPGGRYTLEQGSGEPSADTPETPRAEILKIGSPPPATLTGDRSGQNSPRPTDAVAQLEMGRLRRT